MGEAWHHFRSALGDFSSDLPRMVGLNFLWCLTVLPFVYVVLIFAGAIVRSGSPTAVHPINLITLVVLAILALALAGPSTAAVYQVTNDLAHGDLLELRRYWPAFRHHFRQGWLLALLDAGAATLILLNIWFYWTFGRSGLWLLAIVFAYVGVLWFLVQSYLFALLVELKQPLRLVVRNALFLTIDSMGLTLGLAFVNLLVILVNVLIPPLTFLWPISVASLAHNQAIIAAIERYRKAGRLIRSQPPDSPDPS